MSKAEKKSSKKPKRVMVEINHLGRTARVGENFYPKEFDQESIKAIREAYAGRGSKAKAQRELFKILTAQGEPDKTTYIYRHYFEDVALDTRYYGCKWSVNEMLQCDHFVQIMINRTRSNDKVFTGTLLENFRTAVRIGGDFATNPTNFPLGECLRILKEYCPKGGTYIDPSCGWGVRLLAAAKLGLKYRGFDVNTKLIPRLHELAAAVQKRKPFDYEVIGHGSEIYAKALKGQGDFVFTSPPYFALEEYGNGEGQSTSKYPEYDGWKKGFLNPMMKNMFRYLKPGRYCLINIKDYQKYDLIAATQEAAKLAGFEYVGTERLTVISRINPSAQLNETDEDIQVFFKPGPDPFVPQSKRKAKKAKQVLTKTLF